MIVNAVIKGRDGSTSGSLPAFSYSGQYKVVADTEGSGWRLGFLSSGTFIPNDDIEVDLFLCGGGAGGQSCFDENTSPTNFYGKGSNDGGLSIKITSYTMFAGNGGGGGYTQTYKKVKLKSGTEYSVVVGAGGAANTAGGESSFGQYNEYIAKGGDGAVATTNTGVVGGFDGTPGQGSTTREFGEETGELYSGAGGAGAGYYNGIRPGGAGGAGGSISTTTGGGTYTNASGYAGGTGAVSETWGVGGATGGSAACSAPGGGGGGGIGAGGGGGANGSSTIGSQSIGGTGAQGIVIIRNAR